MATDIEKEVGTALIKSYGEFFKQQYQELAAAWPNVFWEDNKSFSPIHIMMKTTELIPIMELLSSDNMVMSKVLSVLTSLCVEVQQLKQEAFDRHFPFLSVYEEYSDTDAGTQMDAICLLSAFVSRCDDTLLNICTQMFAVFTKQLVNINGIQLHYIINHIGELFTLTVITELLLSKCSLPRRWINYSSQLKSFANHPDQLHLTQDRFEAVLNAADNITSKIMNDDIVQNTLEHLAPLKKSMVERNSAVITSEFSHYLKQAAINLEKLIQEKPNTNNMYKCIKLNALYVLSSHLFGNTDSKFFKTLTELNIKAHSIHITGNTLWFPEQFLQRHLSACGAVSKLAPALFRARHAYLAGKKAALSKDVAGAQATCVQWILKLEDTFSNNHHELCASEIGTHADILLEGLDIIAGIHHSVLSLINLHLSLGIPLSKSMVKSLFELVDTIKAFQNAVNRNAFQITRSINMVVQHLLFQAMLSVLDVKKTLMADKNASKKLDELTCIVIAERALRGSASLERSIAANIALSFIPNSVYIDDTYARLGALLEKVQTLSRWMVAVDNLCDCSWMAWHQNVIPIYFEQNFPTDLNVARLEYFMMVFQDCSKMLYRSDPMFSKKKCPEFVDNIRSLVRERILDSYAQNIETNLRLHIHSHLQLDVINPFTTDMTKKLLLAIDKLKLQCVYIEVVPSVEHYLSTMFYNLTTVVLSDWKTYGEMRQLARFKFNLKTVQDDLPTQTLEQGLDVLEIMRNIHVFVSKYLYNLNNQIFIEKSSNNKHLNSINIRHIANSIRTHGTGIMNTTVNFTYQFLKKKFFTFSQFMYDEHIKSRLMKDLRTFKESKDDMYSYKNAERFNKGIKVLGVDSEGQSYLDLFRDLITQIGNAMGYVRMVRSGGRHSCSDATVFLPSLESVKSFKQLCEDDDLTQKTVTSAENLDHNVEGLISNFIEGTEYFKLLVEVFAPVFRNPKNVHLRNFFVIVPPLTLNHVEHMMLCKDKMTKKDKSGAAFTDDGFCMGVACILKLLDQDSDFETLHWFESVWRHIDDQRQSLLEQQKTGTPQLQQTLALTERKLRTIEDEYRLLYYTLTSARIFFR